MNELGRHLSPRYLPTKHNHDLRRIKPGGVLTGFNELVYCSLNELRLPGMNSARILAQDTSLPSFNMIWEESHPGER